MNYAILIHASSENNVIVAIKVYVWPRINIFVFSNVYSMRFSFNTIMTLNDILRGHFSAHIDVQFICN